MENNEWYVCRVWKSEGKEKVQTQQVISLCKTDTMGSIVRNFAHWLIDHHVVEFIFIYYKLVSKL